MDSSFVGVLDLERYYNFNRHVSPKQSLCWHSCQVIFQPWQQHGIQLCGMAFVGGGASKLLADAFGGKSPIERSIVQRANSQELTLLRLQSQFILLFCALQQQQPLPASAMGHGQCC